MHCWLTEINIYFLRSPDKVKNTIHRYTDKADNIPKNAGPDKNEAVSWVTLQNGIIQFIFLGTENSVFDNRI